MGKKILLADDSITIQKVIELTFSDEDFEVITVGNGRLAIERVQEARPDVVLCDIIMPEKDGYEVCDFIKKSSALSHIPVLLLTGAFEPFDQEKAKRVGCDGYLAKPFEPQTLIAKVKELLSQAKAPAAAPPARPAAVSALTPPPLPSPPGVPAPPIPAPVWTPAARAPEPAPWEPPVETAEPELEPEPSFIPGYDYDEPAVPAPPVAPPAPLARPAPEMSFIPEEPYFEEAGPEVEESAAAPAPSAAAALDDDLYVADAGEALPDPVPAAADDDDLLMEMAPDEAATLAAPPEPPAPLPVTQPPAPSAPRGTWNQATMEVPLEARARASMEAAARSSASVFDEMLDAEPAPAPARAAAEEEDEPELQPEPEPEAPPAFTTGAESFQAFAPGGGTGHTSPFRRVEVEEPTRFAPPDLPGFTPAPPPEFEDGLEPEAEPDLEDDEASDGALPPQFRVADPPPITGPEVSFADVVAGIHQPPVTPPAPAAPPASALPGPSAAEVSVPVDVVAQIAQRVVGQLSERIIREVAWEVIPELAETLIKKEIERLKADLTKV